MRYLAAVRWSREQEAKLRVLLASLNINALPDLAARLGMRQSKSDCEHIKMVTESLQELLQMAFHRVELRSTLEKHIFDYFKLNTSAAIKDAYRHAILNRFKADVKAIKSKSDESSMTTARSDLSWLLGVIRRCDAKLFETVVKEFCEDPDLHNAVCSGAVKYDSAAIDMLSILINILEAMGNGEIITPTSFRVDFLTNWTDTMVKLINPYSFELELKFLEKAIIGVGETLPLVEQKRIYSVCQGIISKSSKSTSGLFNWWAEKLHDAIILDQL